MSRILNLSKTFFNQPKNILPITLSYLYPKLFNYKFYTSFNKLKLDNNYFIFSLDCDTIEDLKFISKLHDKLNGLNILPTYAVPGELLLKDVTLFKDLKKNGAEFINHGYNLHTHYDTTNKKYLSTHFYKDYTDSQIEIDIKKGHDTITKLFNEQPIGFRTPHFGTLNNIKKKNQIYKILSNFNYKFSTSSTPIDSFWNLPIYKNKYGLFEISLTGSFDKPHIILDSWNFKFANKRYFTEDNYFQQICKIKKYFNSKNTNILINIYADPSHLKNWDSFFESIILLQNFRNINYSNLIKTIT